MNVFLQVISIIVVLSALILIVWHMLPNAGVKIKTRIDIDQAAVNYTPSNRECGTVFICALLFRVFVIAAGFIIYCILIDRGDQIQLNQIFDAWLKWDANNYIRIADGYTSFDINGDYSTLVFFPLYSWCLKLVRFIVPYDNAAGLLTSALCYSAACVFLYKLVCIDFKKSVAQKAVILMSIFPFGFFFGAIMSESAFLLTSILTLYFIRKHNWIGAGIAGLAAALSRSAGVFLIIPATVEFIEEYKIFGNIKNLKQTLAVILKKWTWLLLIPAGTCIYLLINYKVAGSPFAFLEFEEKYWNQSTQPFFKTVGSLWSILTDNYDVSTKLSAFGPGLALLLCMYALMIFGIRKHKSMYSAWMLVYLTVNTTMTWPLSLCRYLACAVPAYIILADVCDRNKKLYTAITLASGIMFGIYMTGYLMGKQIM